jgi:hypothetical protein
VRQNRNDSSVEAIKRLAKALRVNHLPKKRSAFCSTFPAGWYLWDNWQRGIFSRAANSFPPAE